MRLSGMQERLLALERSKFALLLGAIVLPFLLQPLLPAGTGGLRAPDVLLPLVLLGGIRAAGGRRLQGVGLLLAAPALLLQAGGYLTRHPALVPAVLISYMAFVGFSTWTVIYAVLRSERVSTDTILGAVCGYLLIALFFSLVFGLIERLQPGSFLIEELAAAAGRPGSPQLHELRPLIYYSFITLTTVGYGDIRPISQIARSYAALEGVIGQIYLTVLIARLVGIYVSNRPPKGPPRE
jgi:hypothetical protein